VDGIVRYTDKITTDRQRVNVILDNVVRGGVDHPADTQIDTIMLWRRGGSFLTAVLMDSIPDTAVPPFIDTVSDADLILTNKVLEENNDPPPAGASRILFGPDATGHFFMLVDGYRLYVSKAYEDKENRVENWDPLSFALVGDGSARAVAGIALASAIFA